MSDHLVLVEAVVPTRRDHTNFRDEVWNFALDQRVFGPRKLLVAFANRKGRFRGLAHTVRTIPPEAALRACLEHLGRGAAAAVAFCDEPVVDGPPSHDLAERFARASEACASSASTSSTGSPATTSCSAAPAWPSTPATSGGPSREPPGHRGDVPQRGTAIVR